MYLWSELKRSFLFLAPKGSPGIYSVKGRKLEKLRMFGSVTNVNQRHEGQQSVAVFVYSDTHADRSYHTGNAHFQQRLYVKCFALFLGNVAEKYFNLLVDFCLQVSLTKAEISQSFQSECSMFFPKRPTTTDYPCKYQHIHFIGKRNKIMFLSQQVDCVLRSIVWTNYNIWGKKFSVLTTADRLILLAGK